jgi:hypothetical protein
MINDTLLAWAGAMVLQCFPTLSINIDTAAWASAGSGVVVTFTLFVLSAATEAAEAVTAAAVIRTRSSLCANARQVFAHHCAFQMLPNGVVGHVCALMFSRNV